MSPELMRFLRPAALLVLVALVAAALFVARVFPPAPHLEIRTHGSELYRVPRLGDTVWFNSPASYRLPSPRPIA